MDLCFPFSLENQEFGTFHGDFNVHYWLERIGDHFMDTTLKSNIWSQFGRANPFSQEDEVSQSTVRKLSKRAQGLGHVGHAV